MFEELDDPTPPQAPALPSVLRRAGQLRRRRQLLSLAVAGGAALSVVAAIALVSAGSSPDSLRVIDSPTPGMVTSEPSPTDGGSPSGSATPAVEGSDSPAPSTSASPTSWGNPWLDPDGKPGWSTGFTWCDAPPTGHGSAPFSGLRMVVTLTRSNYYNGGGVEAKATIHNDGTAAAHFHVDSAGGDSGVLYDEGGRPRSGIFGNDMVVSQNYDLAPGASEDFSFRAETQTCGDTPDDDKTLPAGSYQVAAMIGWTTDGGRTGYWVGEPTPVTLLDGNPPPDEVDGSAPCWSDGTYCGGLPERAPCTATSIPAHDYGATRDLQLSVTSNSGTVRAGDPIALTATIANTAPDLTAHLTVETGGDEGVLLDGTGKAAGGRRPQASGSRTLDIGPGQQVNVSLTVQTRGCAADDLGTAVAPGQYAVQSGVYVTGYGWWTASETPTVVVTP